MHCMNADLSDLLRLLQNLIRLGTIAEVKGAKARVQLGPTLITEWLNWATPRAGSTRTWSAPTVGEQVIVFSPGGDLTRGVILPALYSQEFDAPESSPTTQHSKAAESTKTNAGRREVKLLERAMHALQEQKAFTWVKGEEVFQNPRLERRWEGDQPIRKTLWTGILQSAGVRYRNPYQTRHTYASMMLSAGEHPMWVAKQMGHADWTMIARVYGRWMPDADQTAGSKAEGIFGI
ncbi:hypothetical protein GQ37_009600 [Janthinobacterium sp. BJB1]|nr:hypothetical protein GQ37_009600 [Janthinobacterium sp. BJB1]